MRKLSINGKDVSLIFGCGPNWGRMASESRIFKDWASRIDPRFCIQSVTFTAVNFPGTPSAESVLFVRLSVMMHGLPWAQIVELRGGSAAMLVVLRCIEDNSAYTVLVKQARIATGDFELVEIPAGMIDDGSFEGAAAREIQEELGLAFEESEMKDLTGIESPDKRGLFLSPGLLDESVRLYVAERSMNMKDIEDLQGRVSGIEEEGESITLEVVPLDELPRLTRDAKSVLVYWLYRASAK